MIDSVGRRGRSASEPSRRERSKAARLAEMAGGCSIESLEDRRYLFTLTVDAVPLGASVGTVDAIFGYTIPIFQTSEGVNTERDFDTMIEDFNDEDGGPVLPVEIFGGSVLRLTQVDFPFGGAPVRVVDVTPGNTDDDNNGLSLGFQAGSSVLWELATMEVNEDDVNAEDPEDVATVPMSAFAFSALGGLNVDTTTINFYRVFVGTDADGDGEDDRVLLASFTGGALAAEEIDDGQPGQATYVFNEDDVADFMFSSGSEFIAFDQVEIVSSNNQTITLDDVTYSQLTDSLFADVVASRVFGARVVFSGPLGASVTFTDLLGRDMIASIGLGRPEGSELTRVDLDDNGIPDFNDGIGRIEISGADERSSLRIFGGLITEFQEPQDNNNNVPDLEIDQFVQGGFQLDLVDTFLGLNDEFEDAGFGFFFDADEGAAFGLPPGPSSVIIGSPFDRSEANYNPGGLAPGTAFETPFTNVNGFNDTGFDPSNNFTEGVFYLGGGNFGVLNLHAMVFGSSLFEGAVRGVGLGTLYGSFAIEGDVGDFVVGGNAGYYRLEDDTAFGDTEEDRAFRTASQITIGRSAREVVIGGESRADVTVFARVNEQDLAPPRDVLEYEEREVISSADVNPERTAIGLFLNDRNDFNEYVPRYTFGAGTFRNDTILSAEFVGSVGTSVFINGSLGDDAGFDTDNDGADVYAFAADETRPIVVQSSLGAYTRIVDQDGRTLAALQGGDRNSLNPTRFVFEPSASGVYYLVVSTRGTDADVANDIEYQVTMTGLAPVAFGAYRTAGPSGSNTVTALGGNFGSIRVGTGRWGNAGGHVSPNEVITTDLEDDLLMTFRTGAYSAPAGSLYNVTAGSDIENGSSDAIQNGTLNITTGLDLGNLVTGLSPLANEDGTDGDILGSVIFDIGRHIGVLDIRGAFGVDGDSPDGVGTPASGNYLILTGTREGEGDIGMIRVGGEYFGGGLGDNSGIDIQIPRNSTLGALLVQQDIPQRFTDVGIAGVPTIVTGLGSDVRFIDTPQIDSEASANTSLDIFADTPLTFIDDGGAIVTVQVLGTTRPGALVGQVRVVPIAGSLGVAIAGIDIDLSGGERLDVITTGQAADVVSIGRITLTSAANGAAIRLNGQTEIDVWLIDQNDGDGLTLVENLTVGGDLVALDLQELETLNITGGHLGRTQVPDFGPDTIGPLLGIAATLQGTVGAPLGFSGAVIDQEFDGAIFHPVETTINSATRLAVDDAGGFFDPYLNGLVLRNSFIQDVRVSGAVGDVILQGANTAIINLLANSDNITPEGEFHGIVGNIYAPIINSVNVGDGLLPTGDAPLTEVGIFAEDEIVQVLGGSFGRPAFLSGAIGAFDINPGPQVFTFTNQAGLVTTVGGTGGIGTLQLSGGGDFRDLFIRGGTLSGWWENFGGSDEVDTATVNNVLGTDADFFRSTISARDLTNVTLNGGAYDASLIRINNDIGAITADEFRNSTLGGEAVEALGSVIVGGEDIGSISTNRSIGDISDLLVTIEGSITGAIRANTITRLDLNVDNIITLVNATGDVRGSVVRAGRLDNFSAGNAIRSSQFRIAGAIRSLTSVGEMLNVAISAEGPDSRIDLIRAGTSFAGSITSAGPIQTISATGGDLDAEIETITSRGTIERLDATRDVVLDVNASAAIAQIVAGRHVGRIDEPNVILSRGNIGLVDVSQGQLYSDVRAGGVIDSVRVGQAFNRPGAVNLGNGSIESFARINSVVVSGDFGGDITSYSGGIGAVTINNGSLLPTSTISAFDGSVGSVTVNQGHLMGDIHADYVLFNVTVNASSDGVFGDVGINPALSAGVAFDNNRNQLPTGVARSAAIDGPSITAGQNIGTINVPGGSVFETFIHAERAIGNITIAGSVQNDGVTSARGSVVAAGGSIFALNVGGNLVSAFVLAGAQDFGEDNLPGGLGVNADTVRPGEITNVNVGGASANTIVSAGVDPGADGVYTSGDDSPVLGTSFIQNVFVAGGVASTAVFSDSLSSQIVNDARFRTGGFQSGVNDPLIFVGSIAAAGTLVPNGGSLPWAFGNESGVVSHSGPGQVFWNANTGRFNLINTNTSSTVGITSDTGTFTGLDVVTNNNAGVGTLTIGASLQGNSSVVIDGNLGALNVGVVNTTGRISIGGRTTAINTSSFLRGDLDAEGVSNLTITGAYGAADADLMDEVGIDLLSVGSLNITGATRGRINIDRDAGAINLGSVETSLIRAGGGIGSFISGRLAETRISVRDFLTTAVVNGDMFDSAFHIGGDLGRDADYGGTGLDADEVTSGFGNSFTINGDFIESDIVAGFLRGADGFFGTGDDTLAPGRSSIGSVTITGEEVGSGFNSESFRIASTGGVGAVTINGQPATAQSNFAIDRPRLDPEPIQVVDLVVSESAQLYTATLTFNQPIDASSIATSLAISEVRGVGEIEIRLIEGLDFETKYDDANNELNITFSREITERDLPQLAGVPGAGVFRFTLDADSLRGANVGSRLDGDADGFATDDDDYSADDIVGDAGDKTVATQTSVTNVTGLPLQVDFQAPISLDIVLDDNFLPDQLPDPNTTFTIRGSIGDHPDHASTVFRFAADQDVYSVTLQAGQILRLSELTGLAADVTLTLVTPDGTLLNVNGGGSNADAVFLPNQTQSLARQFTGDTIDPIVIDNVTRNYLVKNTGQYLLIVGSLPDLIDDLTFVPDLSPIPGALGAYAFDITIFDDGDSGFAATSDSGNGAAIVNAPQPAAFAGPDGVFGTSDDQAVFRTGAFTFTLNAGPDGLRGTPDDTVSGDNGDGGVVSTRTGTTLVSTIDASIGTPSFAGVPEDVFPDVDVFHLNNRAPIANGSTITVTVRLDALGADLGSTVFGGSVQFGVFDTTDATDVDDALLLFAPTDFSPNGGEPGVIASGPNGSYGFNANGDFFITFRAAGSQLSGGVDPASYAVMIQGVLNTDYALTVVTRPPASDVTPRTQNFLIETQGGLIDWLLADGSAVELQSFDPEVLGFTGRLPNGQDVESYITERLVENLNKVYADAGVNVNFSTNPADFEFQDFSTVFLSDTPDPLNDIFGGGIAGDLADLLTAFIGDSTLASGFEAFGFSQRSDPFNIDRNDQAVVFAPSLGLLGLDPSVADIDQFILSLTAAVGRRSGELMGLRLTGPHMGGETDPDGADLFDLLSGDSVTRRPTDALSYSLSPIARPLSDTTDFLLGTNFFIGHQSAANLLSLYVL